MSEDPLDGVAIIGMACRLPGADTPDEFWRNLCEGVESVTRFSDDDLVAAGVPASRLNDPRYVKASPTLRAVDGFDAAFFGYSPREAGIMDPQHRLFLETCWAALEDAGYDPETTAPDVVGVFAGAGSSLTSYLVANAGHPDLQGQTAGLQHIANDKDFLATRVSYKLNLTGPSLTVQTACSTSLVAVHLACQSLLNGECDMALAGASMIRFPHVSGYLAEPGSVHSPDGHCRAFDAAGGGTIFGSGVAAVLLKDLRTALAAGDSIYAVIKASAINNDGSAKVSYTAASITGQSRAMVEALEVARISAETIGYVECHATGTPAGDPIEIQALTKAFRTHTDRRRFCAIGSVKTNIGHPEQTAGLAGLIKVALALSHKRLPRSLHFSTPNPNLHLEDSPFYVQTQTTEWPDSGIPRRAAVNSLGIGGTNAFVLLEEPPALPATAVEPVASTRLVCLSAKSAAALRARAGQFASMPESPSPCALDDLAYTANVSRTGLPHRLACLCTTQRELRDALARAASGAAAANVMQGVARPRSIAFLFSGQGAQYVGMSAELYGTADRFREALDECEALLRPHLDRSLFDVLFARGDTPRLLDETRFTQPALFAVEYALAQLWQSWGIVPGAVMGHSVGELVAACLAGVFDLADAINLVAQRAALMQELPPIGGMEVIFAGEATVRQALAGIDGAIDVAAFNSPGNTVVSGERVAIDMVRQRLQAEGVSTRPLAVSHAFHSALVEPVLPAIERVAASISARPPRLLLVSNVTGRPMEEAPDAQYWVHHARRPVSFLEGMRTLRDHGHSIFLEIGPGASSLALGRECLDDTGFVWLASLSKTRGDWRTILESVGRLYVEGCTPAFREVSGAGRRRVALPTYPFEHKRHWLRPAAPAAAQWGEFNRPAGHDASASSAVDAAAPRTTTIGWDLEASAYLADHHVYGIAVVPTAAAADALLGKAREHFGAPARVEDFVCHEALVFSDEGRATFGLSLVPSGPDKLIFRVVSEDPEASGPGVEKATGVLRRVAVGDGRDEDMDWLPATLADSPRFPEEIDPDRYYAHLSEIGLDYGPSFRAVHGIWRGTGETLGRVRIPPELACQAAGLHPTLLDACLHLYPSLLNGEHQQHGLSLHLPTGFDTFTVHRAHACDVWAHMVLRAPKNGEAIRTVDLRLYDDRSRAVATLEGLALQPIARDALAPRERTEHCLYHVAWEEQPFSGPVVPEDQPATWLLLADQTGLAAGVARAIEQHGGICHLAERSSRFSSPAPRRWLFDPGRQDHFTRLLESVARAEGRAPDRILHLWSLDSAAFDRLTSRQLSAAEAAVAGSAMTLVQAAARTDGFDRTRLWLITRGAQRVLPHESAHPVQAMLWGFARTAALEVQRVWGGIIDLADSGDPIDAEANGILQNIAGHSGEQQIALRGGIRRVARLVPLGTDGEDVRPMRVRDDATYLITGGLGMLGLSIARWLVESRGARSIALVSRRAPTPEAVAAVAALEAAGARIVIVCADVSKANDVARLFRRLDAGLPPLAGVVHCAGVLDDGILQQMDWARFTHATAPKVRAGWLLHKYTANRDLDFFQVHSSVLSLTGSPGQVNYTSGNAFVDALVDYRRAGGLPATAINWGPWADAGMAAHAGARGEAMWRSRGMGFIRPELGVRVLDHLFDRPAAHAAVAVCNWSRFVEQLQASPAFYGRVASKADVRKPAGPGRLGALRTRLEDVPSSARQAVLLDVLREQVAAELGLEGEVDAFQSLQSLGVDSLMSVGLANRLEASLDLRVPVARLMRGPSLDELARELVTQLAPALPKEDVPVKEAQRAPDASMPARPARSQPWLVLFKPRPAARVRLVCFNFAGGGAATYRSWADDLAPEIELLALEPPGRSTRLDERPVTRVEDLLDGVLPELLPLLDRPCALFGHCLGGLNLFEVARHLLRDGRIELAHVFVSGSRPPHRLSVLGRFEEDLLTLLLQDPEFDPSLPFHEQGDETFASVIRQFNIGASNEFLVRPDLRRLVLPAVRADFETVWRYRPPALESPWDVPITCFSGLEDRYVTREDAMEWHRYTRREFRMHFRPGDHFLVVDDRDFIVRTINSALV